MRKVLLSMALAIFATSAFAQNATTTPQVKPSAPTAVAPPVVDKKAPDIVFEKDTMDYGTIPHFADGKRVFKFKNKGKSPLIITNCQGSCGCTVPTWPKEPIMPGKTGEINVQYATDRVGHFQKTVTVTSNAKTPTKVLTIKGEVLSEPATKPGETPQVTDKAPTPMPPHGAPMPDRKPEQPAAPVKDEHAGHNH